MLVPWLGYVNDYGAPFYSQYANLNEKNGNCRPGWEELAQCY